jgi:hypothetical protein
MCTHSYLRAHDTKLHLVYCKYNEFVGNQYFIVLPFRSLEETAEIFMFNFLVATIRKFFNLFAHVQICMVVMCVLRKLSFEMKLNLVHRTS